MTCKKQVEEESKKVGVIKEHSIPSPIRRSPFAAPHTRRFCSQSFYIIS